jgi:hypothetical protein
MGPEPPGCQSITRYTCKKGPQFTVFSLPGGDLERQRWVRVEEEGMFSAEVDVLELWELFHPRWYNYPRSQVLYCYLTMFNFFSHSKALTEKSVSLHANNACR